MADFCKECSIKIFGKDFRDMVGLSTREDTINKIYAPAFCEECGPILVDHWGTKVYEFKNAISS